MGSVFLEQLSLCHLIAEAERKSTLENALLQTFAVLRLFTVVGVDKNLKM
jgi:hypothetical protein